MRAVASGGHGLRPTACDVIVCWLPGRIWACSDRINGAVWTRFEGETTSGPLGMGRHHRCPRQANYTIHLIGGKDLIICINGKEPIVCYRATGLRDVDPVDEAHRRSAGSFRADQCQIGYVSQTATSLWKPRAFAYNIQPGPESVGPLPRAGVARGVGRQE
jgi:hypothetical protein